ncbi:MAG: phosphoglycerate dehydrogenase [Saccharofermentanales bacterium]
MRILVTPTSFNASRPSKARDMLERFTEDIVYNPYGRPLTAQEIIPLLEGVDGYIAGLDSIDAEVISHAPSSLKVISRYGVGFDRVDVDAAAGRHIAVTNTPGVNAESVADLAFGLILAVARKIVVSDRKVRAGEWPRLTGMEIYGKTIGILGLGAIGKGVARRAKGFSMEVQAYDPFFDKRFAAENGVKECTVEELIHSSDIISLHLPMNDHTRNIISADAIRQMKQGAIVINTSRGGLVDESAAYQALKNGWLGGLGLDVFEKEPPADSPLFELDNVVVTAHAGAHTVEAVDNMGMLSVLNLIEVLSGSPCRYVINGVK